MEPDSARKGALRVTIRNTASAVSSERDSHEDDTAGARKETWMEGVRGPSCREMPTAADGQDPRPATKRPGVFLARSMLLVGLVVTS